MLEKKGLSSKEAKKKLAAHGFNEIKEINRVSSWLIFWRQIKNNFIIYLLFASALMSFLVGKDTTGFTILAVIAVVIGAGFFQEFKAEKAISALKNLIVPIAIAIRDGREKTILAKEIVPGDLIVLRAGDKIPADGVVLTANELRVNEAMITGETKEMHKLPISDSPSETDKNRVFMGTVAISGRALVRVTATGMKTAFGRIAQMISQAEKTLPLQKKTNRIARYMVLVAITVSLLTGLIMVRSAPVLSLNVLIDVLVVVIALSVSAFPEGLPVVLVSTLANGARRMAAKNAIVNRMSIIETLGETTLVCADKTGTITKGEMTVRQINADDELFAVTGSGYETQGDLLKDGKKFAPPKNLGLSRLLKTAVLCNDAFLERKTEKQFKVNGSPTEAALLILGAKLGVYSEDLDWERTGETAFNSSRKMMSVFGLEKNCFTVYAKGAPETILKKCAYQEINGQLTRLTDTKIKKIQRQVKDFAGQASRVLAFAYKTFPAGSKEKIKTAETESKLVFLGLAALEDPPRPEVAGAISACRQAGIKVKMITGDNPATAARIGAEIGLLGKILTGEELDSLSEEEFLEEISQTVIFARVRPEHKLKLVNGFKKIGEIVTMTGDGVNDAPALKEAHIGVAMGEKGTDVTREVADLILKDDNFATITAAIKEGRAIFNNIQKFVAYELSCNFAELFMIFIGVALGLPTPLLALQILFMNLVTDNLPSISLGFNPSSGDIMSIPPRRQSNILNKELITLLLFNGALMGILSLSVYIFSLQIAGLAVEKARTLALLTLIFLEIASAFNFRSFRKLVLNRSPFVNRYLAYASAISLSATALILYTPLNKIFQTVPISLPLIGITILAAGSIIFIFDLLKKFKIITLKN